MKLDNYNDFDKITIYAKRDKKDAIIKSYNLFQWELVEELDNRRYEDIVDLSFVRPHKLKNKDKLQWLQVCMEEKINEKAKLEKNKNAFSTSFGILFGLIGLSSLTLGFLGLFKVLKDYTLVKNIVLLVVGSISSALCAVFVPIIYKKEKTIFNQRNKELDNRISEICQKTFDLIGDKHE